MSTPELSGDRSSATHGTCAATEPGTDDLPGAGGSTAGTGDADEPGRFVLSAPPAVLGPLIGSLTTDPGVQVVAVSGPADEPRRAVVRMSPERAAALTTGADPIVVEPDFDLTPPDPPHPPLETQP